MKLPHQTCSRRVQPRLAERELIGLGGRNRDSSESYTYLLCLRNSHEREVNLNDSLIRNFNTDYDFEWWRRGMTAIRRSRDTFQDRVQRPTVDGAKAARYSLSQSELDVLYLMQQGIHDPEIAARLRISGEAVTDKARSIVEKMGVRSRTEAAVRAIREGVFESA